MTTAIEDSVEQAGQLVPVRRIGDFVPFSSHDLTWQPVTIYVNRNNVTDIAPSGSGTKIHLVGDRLVCVDEPVNIVAAALT